MRELERHSPYGLEWEARQHALGLDTGSDWLDPHEIDQLEHFHSLEPHIPLRKKIKWIPRNYVGRIPTDDFVWVANDGVHIEMKRVHRAGYKPIRNSIKQALDRLRKWDPPIRGVKENFMVDIGQRELRTNVREELEEYNIRNPHNQIKRLWVLWRGNLEEITLRK